jgi:beta-1,4-mannosyl-glycoprotein beta-1,4-N-acetylglucosaminyltransferase
MIIDAITFGGELDMLEGRLATKYEDVDAFVIVEGDLMYANQPKGYLYEENQERFKKYANKIVYTKIKSLNNNDAWANDYHQRSQLTEAVKSIAQSDDDVIIVCDTDEWYDSTVVAELDKTIAFNMPKYHMSLHWYHKHELTGIAGLWKFFKDKDLNDERWRRNGFDIVTGGHHLTSMGTLQYLINKVRGFAHQELISSDLDEQLKHCWTYGHDLANDRFVEITLESANYPQWILEHKAPENWYRKRP